MSSSQTPEVFHFEDGEFSNTLPSNWQTEEAGKQASYYAACLKYDVQVNNTGKKIDFEKGKGICNAFRLIGSITLHFRIKQFDAFILYLQNWTEKTKEKQKRKKADHKSSNQNSKAGLKKISPDKRIIHVDPWNEHGEPKSEMPDKTFVRKLMDSLEEYNAIEVISPGEVEWQRYWLELANQLGQPGGEWMVPFVFPSITLSDIKEDAEKIVSIPINLYVGRLFFYLIADSALANLIEPLTPVGSVRDTFDVGESEIEPIFSRGSINFSPFSIAGILQSIENVGYPSAVQPPEIALTMKSYQLHTLQWMLNQESLENGLNGCFYETRKWRPSTSSSNDQQGGHEYYVSLFLGDFRLSPPPLVRGGMLCEEMGLGKTLELVSLIVASRKLPPPRPTVQPKRKNVTETGATLVVCPDSLVEQWRQEIRKSLKIEHQLEVNIFLEKIDNNKFRDEMVPTVLNSDIVLTTFRMVETEKHLQQFMWRRVVIDEMQMIRSSTTTVAKMCENLSAHARWMVSGTPLYSSVRDLNGLLNFLQVIPFSLSDSIDGFFGSRIEKPLSENNSEALELVKLMLSCLMMRHSKQQKYLTGPLAGKSILELPGMSRELCAVDFSSYEEEAMYRHMEELSLRAARTYTPTDRSQRRQDRPAVIAFDLLRQFCISPSFLSGGNGVAGEARRLSQLWRALVPLSTPTVGSDNSSTTLDQHLSTHTLPANEIRDFFLSKTAKTGGNKAISASDVSHRLQQAQHDVADKKKVLIFEKHHTGVDGIPRRRWNWLLRCITSGKYILVQLCRQNKLSLNGSEEVRRLVKNCPALFSLAIGELVQLRRYTKLQQRWDDKSEEALKMDEYEMFRMAGVRFKETSSSLLFQPSGNDELPLHPPHHHHTPTSSKEEEDGGWVDFYADEMFWRKSLEKVVMSTAHTALKKSVQIAKNNWERTSSSGFCEPQSVRQFLKCAEIIEASSNEKVSFEAIYWYTGSKMSSIGRKRSWFQIIGKPAPLTNGLAQVTFLDGEKMSVEAEEIRFHQSYAQNVEAARDENELGLNEVLVTLKLGPFVKNFATFENNLEKALKSSNEELERLFLNDSDSKFMSKESTKMQNSTRKRKIEEAATLRVAKFRQAANLRGIKKLKAELFPHSKLFYSLVSEERKVLSRKETFLLVSQIIPTLQESTWNNMWKLEEGGESESLSWISVCLGFKGELQGALPPRDVVPRNLMALRVDDPIQVRIGLNDRYGNLGVGWFEGVVKSTPSIHSVHPELWTVLVLGEKNPRQVPASFVRKYKKIVNVEEEEGREEEEEEQEEEGSEKEGGIEEDSGLKRMKIDTGSQHQSMLGEVAQIFNLHRVKFAALPNTAILTDKEFLKIITGEIKDARKTLPDLERYEALLIRAFERGGEAGAKLASQQGFQALQQLIDNDPRFERPKCTICLDALSDEPVVLGCLHLFCKECLVLLKKTQDSPNRPFSCPLCRQPIEFKDMFLVKEKVEVEIDEEQKEEEEEINKPHSTSSVVRQGNNPEWTPAIEEDELTKRFSHLPDGLEMWDAYNEMFLGLSRTVQTLIRLCGGVSHLGVSARCFSEKFGSKINRIIADVKQVQGKVVIVSQFHKSTSLLTTIFESIGISAVKMSRGDSAQDLSTSLHIFTEDEHCKVLCLHSGSGASGLTLTCAKHIFLLEPFLKAGEEAQAINRIHRIGQNQKVYARCYYMRGTIEERILSYRNLTVEETQSTTEEGGLATIIQDDASNSIVSLSNEFISYVLGASSSLTTEDEEE